MKQSFLCSLVCQSKFACKQEKDEEGETEEAKENINKRQDKGVILLCLIYFNSCSYMLLLLLMFKFKFKLIFVEHLMAK